MAGSGGGASFVEPPLDVRLAFCEALHFDSVRRHRSPEALDTPIRAGGREEDDPGEGEAGRDDCEEFGGDIYTGERSTLRAVTPIAIAPW